MALFSKGIMLTQNKEPALSSPIVDFNVSQTRHFKPHFPYTDTDNLTPQNIIALAEQGEIIDLFDGEYLSRKLMINQGVISTLFIDAIDDQPYVSSKTSAILHMQNEIAFGIKMCAKALNLDIEGEKASSVIIEVYKNIGDTNRSIPSKIDTFSVRKIPGGYPALPSAQRTSSNERIRELTIDVTTLIHLSRAIIHNIIQTSTFVTVAGNSVLNPLNLEVSFGVSITDTLARCGINKNPTKVVIGGSMTGISIIDTDNTYITGNTTAVLAFHEESHELTYGCIGCGRCVKECPSGLSPMSIYNAMDKRVYSELARYDCKYCISCGICSYVCPSRLRLSESVKEAKKAYIVLLEERELLEEVRRAQILEESKETEESPPKKEKKKFSFPVFSKNEKEGSKDDVDQV